MLEFNNVNFSYKKSKPLFTNFNLNLQPGVVVGLLGKNGEGKTSLLKLISGLLFPDQGEVLYLGHPTAKREINSLQSIFFLEEDVKLPRTTVKKYFEAFRDFYPTYDESIEKRCLYEFELDEGMHLHKLSLGQKKKCAITFALAANTPVLLLDEPTNGLDIPSKSIFRKLVCEMMTDERIIIISTHQVRDLEQLIDDIVILDDNAILLHERTYKLEEKLSFGMFSNDSEVLYKDSTFFGNVGISVNKNQEPSQISLELLFNGLMKNKKGILQQIKGKESQI